MVSQWNIINANYKNLEGYKRVAWPPVSEERIVKEFTPQPQPQQSLHPDQQQHQPTQGANYNNKQSSVRPSSPHPTKYQQSQQQHQHNEHQHQHQRVYHIPVQYDGDAPLNRPSSTHDPHHQQHNGQHQQPQHEQHQNAVHRYESSSSISSSWKPIRAPVTKHQQQYGANSTAPNYASYAPSARQQSVQYQQPQNYQQQQQSTQQHNVRASSYDNYRQLPPQQQQHLQARYQQYQQSFPTSNPCQFRPDPYPEHKFNLSPKSFQQHQQYQQHQQHQQPSWAFSQQQQQPIPKYRLSPSTTTNYQSHQSQVNQFNSYSQPQQQQHQVYQQRQQTDQTDFQASHNYRCASPGIITLRKEVPVSQKPAPVFTSQPAALSYQGGSNMRGDLKWPPQEYKEAAERENEERRKIAAGPVCRPRRVNRFTNWQRNPTQ